MSPDDPIARLARQIESHTRTDERLLLSAEEIAALRRHGASQLHAICAEFVDSVNAKLSNPVLELAPREFAAGSFRDSGTNLMQIGGHGRLVQIAFESTRQPFSTDKYRIPYTLEGEVRTYNQEMLERGAIHTQGLFYCSDRDGNAWRFSDWRSNRTGLFGREFLAGLIERLF